MTSVALLNACCKSCSRFIYRNRLSTAYRGIESQVKFFHKRSINQKYLRIMNPADEGWSSKKFANTPLKHKKSHRLEEGFTEEIFYRNEWIVCLK